MPAAHAGTTVTTDRINLVNKNDTRSVFFGLLEHLAHTAGTDTDKHFHEVGTGNSKERHFGLAGNRFGQQCFTRTWLPHHQYATGNFTAQTLETAWVAQKLDQLAHFFLGFVTTGDIGQRGFDLVFGQQSRLALAKAHRVAAPTGTTLHLAHKEHHQRKHDQNRESGNQQLHPQALALWLLADDGDIVFYQIAHQAVVLDGGTHGFKGRAIAAAATDGIAVYGNLLHTPGVHFLKEGAVGHLARFAGGRKIVHHGHEDGSNHKPHQQVFRQIIHSQSPLLPKTQQI